MRRWGNQQWNELSKTQKRIWIAVSEDKRQRLFTATALVNEVNNNAFNLSSELSKPINRLFLGTPVEAMLPILQQFFKIDFRRTIIPMGITESLWPSGRCQPRLQVMEERGRDVDFERVDGHIVNPHLTHSPHSALITR